LWLYVVPSAARGVGEDERLRRYVSHLGDELSLASVVGNPFRVEVGLAWGESPVDGFAVDLGGPLPVGSVQLWGSAWQRQLSLPQRLCRGARLSLVMYPMSASWRASSR